MLIAISQRNDKNKHGAHIDNLENNYIDYLESFGIQLIPIPNTAKNIQSYFENFPIKAVILSGGNDVNPQLYGEEPEKGLAVSEERDKTEKILLEIAIEKKLPILGICRGMQFINVFFKGKLIQNLNQIGSNHIIPCHTVQIQYNQDLPIKELQVNSYHNQGLTQSQLSPELESFAKASDGIIEGIHHHSLPIAGIQWHPERKSPEADFNKIIIQSFLKRELFWK